MFETSGDGAGEIAVSFLNSSDETLVGVWHPADSTPRATIVMLHGWSGTRSGPHQMLTRAARVFCAQGFHCLRFDFAGRGDSDGDALLTSLHSMQSDADCALKWATNRSDAPVFLLGLCSGCEISFAALSPEIAGLILWSAPVFAAVPSRENNAQKRGENLGHYARKLLAPATWRKILRGHIDTKNVGKALSGGGGAAYKNLESNEPGQLPPGFRTTCLNNWKTLAPTRPILMVYGGNDPIRESASAWYEKHTPNLPAPQIIANANHSFYGLEWEREVFERTLLWLENQVES